MSRATLKVFFCAIIVLTQAASVQANIVGWVASYLLGKAVDEVWDEVTGKPDIFRLERRLETLERELSHKDGRMAKEIAELRTNLTSKTSRADYERLVEGTIDRLARLEVRVDRVERGVAHHSSEIMELQRRLAVLESQGASRKLAPNYQSYSRSLKSNVRQLNVTQRTDVRRGEVRSQDPKSPKQTRAREILGESIHHYWNGNYQQAADGFIDSHELERSNCICLYFLALAQRQLGDETQADLTLRKAVEIEREKPVEDFGILMQRVQGKPRLWLEAARKLSDRHLKVRDEQSVFITQRR